VGLLDNHSMVTHKPHNHDGYEIITTIKKSIFPVIKEQLVIKKNGSYYRSD
jgi:hypothetical protein